jgi:cytochrome c-type biogenesis protein CcmF
VRRLSRSYVGMQLAHLGVVMTVLGVAFTSVYSLGAGCAHGSWRQRGRESVPLCFSWVSRRTPGRIFLPSGARWMCIAGDRQITVLHPEKRFYFVQRNTMTEAAIDAGLFRDLVCGDGRAAGK